MDRPAPDVGAMRHRLSYQVRSTALDEMNEPTEAWATVGTYWARVEPLTGMELYNARQLKATTGHKVLMRAAGRVFTAAGRFLFESTGRVFNLDQVFRVDERNAYLSIHCSEQTPP